MNCSECMNIMVVHWVFIPGWSRVFANLGESQWNHSVSRLRASKLALFVRICGQDSI